MRIEIGRKTGNVIDIDFEVIDILEYMFRDFLSNVWGLTEFRQPIQVQSHLEMPGILVQLGRIQCT